MCARTRSPWQRNSWISSCRSFATWASLLKTEGPSQVLAFLGILLDTTRCEARLPPDKLADLRDILQQCNSRNSITKNELASLLGKLSFAARVVVPSRTFMSSVGPEGQIRPPKDQATLSGSSRHCMLSRYQVVERLPRRLERQVFLPPQHVDAGHRARFVH